MKKENLINKSFSTVKDKLEYIQKNCYEPVLFEDLKQLFKAKGFNNVRIEHGSTEFGKDLVFSAYDNLLNEEKWFSVIVKNKKAGQNDFLPGSEIGNQINLSFQVPYTDNMGAKHSISHIFIVINGSISTNATVVIENNFEKHKNYIKIWDYQDLEREISNHTKDSFLNNLTPSLNEFVNQQIKFLSDISKTNSLLNLDMNDINDIFINTQITISKEIKKINNYIAFSSKDEKFEQEDFDSKTILNSNNNFIIHGLPTSGKTLFLKNLGLKTLNGANGKPNAVFYIDLINCNDSKFSLQKYIEDQFKFLTKGEIFDKEDYNKVLIIIDSIDFIKSDKLRTIILKSIDEFNNNNSYKNLQILLATRSLELIRNSNFLNDYKDTEILPFNFSQAHSLVKKIIPNNSSKANNFIKALKDNLLDSSLQRTPLALTLMAILYRDDKIDLKELPANVYELYNRFTDIYLDKWDHSKGITHLYQYEQTKNILSFIAFHFHKNNLNRISEEDLISFLSSLRQNYNYDELNNIENFVSFLKTKQGVFYFDDQDNSFMFFNHYFQEFFTSLSIEDEDESTLLSHFYDEWWTNTLVFYCGKSPKSFGFHNSLINEIIPIDAFQKLHYLYNHSKCLQASHSISIGNRNKIVSKLVREYNSIFKDISTNNLPEKFFLNDVPYVNVVNQSRVIFDHIFSSKHVATSEVIDLFEKILIEDKEQLDDITVYNLAYFLSFQKNSSKYFQIVSDYLISKDIVWSRILYVDISFLNLKKQIDEKQYLRIKRKMSKNKFLIQHHLKSTVTEKNSEKNNQSSENN